MAFNCFRSLRSLSLSGLCALARTHNGQCQPNAFALHEFSVAAAALMPPLPESVFALPPDALMEKVRLLASSSPEVILQKARAVVQKGPQGVEDVVACAAIAGGAASDATGWLVKLRSAAAVAPEASVEDAGGSSPADGAVQTPADTGRRPALPRPSTAEHQPSTLGARRLAAIPLPELDQQVSAVPEGAADTDAVHAAFLVNRQPRRDPTLHPFSAKAFYVGKALATQLRKVERKVSQQGYTRIWSGPDSRMFALSSLEDWAAGSEEERKRDIPSTETYLAVFQHMDTIVFFNGRGQEGQIWEQLTGSRLSSPNIEEFKVLVQSSLRDPSRIGADHIMLQAAQPDMVKTIAYLLAQTVALHFYEMEVDNQLKIFQDINLAIEASGDFRPAGKAGGSKDNLMRMVARNNIMRTGILSSKIGLTKRFEAAWKDPECDRIYEHLRGDMEIDRRYEDLEGKFDLIQDNLKYFLELLQNKKSDFLEYMIVLLIAAEICVSLFDLWSREALSSSRH